MLQNNQPFFFSELFNCNHYFNMLQTKFLLQLIVAGQPVSVRWFVQDGVRPYTANLSQLYCMKYLVQVTSYCVTGPDDCGQVST